MISLLRSKFDLFNSRAVYLSADKLSVYHLNRGKLGSTYLFDVDDVGRANFGRYLQETPNTPTYLLLDIIEEEFRLDTIPHVFGSDRKALIERKQSRLFRDAVYFYTENQGREEEGRHDDKVLFMALTNYEIIKPWLDLLDNNKVPLTGIISLPQLIQSYIKTLPDISNHALIVTLQSISGLRQTFFQNKLLKISRLSKLPRYGTVPYAPKVNSEIEKIQRYLNSLRLIPNDAALDIYIIADKSVLDEMERQKASSSMIKKHYLDVNKLVQSAGLDSDLSTPFSDQLFIYHLLTIRPENCYASKKEMRYSSMRKMRIAMNSVSVLMLIISFIYSGLYFMDGITLKQQSEDSKNKADFYQARYNLAKERLPKTPVEPAQIKVAVDAVKTLNDYRSTPYEMMSFLGKTLEKFPSIKLEDMEWNFSVDPKTNSDKPVNAENKSYKYFQIASIKARIVPFDGNYREAISTVNKFAETLRSSEVAYAVSILSFPLDISSTARLQGGSNAVGKEALFSLKAVIGIN